MFNVGKIIKVLSIILGFALFILILFIGAQIWNKTNLYDDASSFMLIVGVSGFIISIIFTILFYGFGSLIDSNNQILYLLKNKK